MTTTSTATLLEDDLRDFLYSNWSLDNAGITKTDIAFELTDANEKHPAKPQIYVTLFSFRRLQAAEPNLYEFTFVVSVALMNKTVLKTDSAQLLNWRMVDHVKKMLDNGKPTGWEYVYLSGGVNAGVRLGLLAEENLWDCTVTAAVPWPST